MTGGLDSIGMVNKELNRKEWMSKITLVHSDDGQQPFPALMPFAWDEVMCARAVERNNILLHVWRHRSAFIIGLRDRKLPYAQKAISWLRAKGYDAVIRNSGGAAVPLDQGVVNLSLVLPNPKGHVHLHEDFAKMADLIRSTLARWTNSIHEGEVQGAYCPGDYDLSIGGRKFCGIAQRRKAKGFVIQAFIIVEGEGAERAALARTFYELASGDESSLSYPVVQDKSMGSLKELAGVSSVEEYVTEIRNLIRAEGGQESEATAYMMAEQEINRQMQLLKERYEQV